MKNIVDKVEKLSPKDGDIVHIKFKKEDKQTIRRAKVDLSKWSLKAGIKAMFIISTDKSKIDISLLDENEMEKHGWVKK